MHDAGFSPYLLQAVLDKQAPQIFQPSPATLRSVCLNGSANGGHPLLGGGLCCAARTSGPVHSASFALSRAPTTNSPRSPHHTNCWQAPAASGAAYLSRSQNGAGAGTHSKPHPSSLAVLVRPAPISRPACFRRHAQRPAGTAVTAASAMKSSRISAASVSRQRRPRTCPRCVAKHFHELVFVAPVFAVKGRKRLVLARTCHWNRSASVVYNGGSGDRGPRILRPVFARFCADTAASFMPSRDA